MTMLTMFTSTPDDENEVVKTYYYMKSDMSCQINPFDD